MLLGGGGGGRDGGHSWHLNGEARLRGAQEVGALGETAKQERTSLVGSEGHAGGPLLAAERLKGTRKGASWARDLDLSDVLGGAALRGNEASAQGLTQSERELGTVGVIANDGWGSGADRHGHGTLDDKLDWDRAEHVTGSIIVIDNESSGIHASGGNGAGIKDNTASVGYAGVNGTIRAHRQAHVTALALARATESHVDGGAGHAAVHDVTLDVDDWQVNVGDVAETNGHDWRHLNVWRVVDEASIGTWDRADDEWQAPCATTRSGMIDVSDPAARAKVEHGLLVTGHAEADSGLAKSPVVQGGEGTALTIG